jgi:tetratricopeptide (TPR) repeat protein
LGSLPYGIDAETYAKVQKRLAEQQAKEPSAQTQTDALFEAGVKEFDAGNYHDAAAKFAEAMELAPDDMILPYAYAQALFASGQYSKAAEALRAALQNVSPSEEGVFYPRGLYPDDDTLFEQIEDLLDEVEDYSFDADMQLLLGYNLLGIGETEYARGPLERAAQDARNARAAKVLLNLVDKLEAALTTEAGSPPTQTETPAALVQTPPESKAETSQKRTDVLGRVKAAAPSNAVTPQPQADTNDPGQTPVPPKIDGVSPNTPSEPGSTPEPENLGTGLEAGSADANEGGPQSGSGPPIAPDQSGKGNLAGALGWSATPTMVVLLAAAGFCLLHADKLSHPQVSK